jgi:chaperone required for assembly of F1-ATPase
MLAQEVQIHRQQMADYTKAVVDNIGEMDKAIAYANLTKSSIGKWGSREDQRNRREYREKQRRRRRKNANTGAEIRVGY